LQATCRHHYFLANNFIEVSLDSACGRHGNGLIKLLIRNIRMESVGDASQQIYFSNSWPNHDRQ
jgi:hypothetical protein